MIQDPTVGLRNAMAAVDLYPGDIAWDGAFHRFPGAGKKKSNTSGWYKAFPDRKGGVFGDHSNGLKVNWQADRSSEPTKSMRAEWAEEDARRKKERAAASKKAIAEATVVWNNAVKAPAQVLGHPYLKKKEIESCERLRISRETELDGWTLPAGILLIPMLVDKKLVNLQRITRDGQKLYWPKAPASGASLMVGGKYFREDTTKTIYVCEGWATAWTVSEATKSPCMVAFSKDGLLPVAKKVKERFQSCAVVIAADNDRWTVVKQKEGLPDIPNPGVHYAKLAADEVGCEVAIPDFRDLSKKPTDFDDVRLQEGMGAVQFWIEPDNAGRATILPDQPGDEPEDDPDREPAWVTEAPFRCLGYNRKQLFFLPRTGQVIDFNVNTLTNRAMLMLAPKEFWDKHFGAKKGPRWMDATSAVVTQCTSKGVFAPGQVRGVGFWRDDSDRVLAHLGDRLLAPGDTRPKLPEVFVQATAVYDRRPRIAGPDLENPMSAAEARHLFDLFGRWDWEDEASPMLLAGWTALAPFCGALKWRPHVWVCGAHGSGKSEVLKRLVIPLLADMRCSVEGGSTEAGIRQGLDSSALPVVCDEVEQTSRRKAGQIQQVVGLLRSASSADARIFKGTPSGQGMSFEVRTMFLLASIAPGLRDEADKSRVAVLPLRSPRSVDHNIRRERWIQLKRELRQRANVGAGRRLIARTLTWARSGKLDDLIGVMQSAASTVLESEREGDQYGVLAAGARMLLDDEVPDDEAAIHWLKDLGIASRRAETKPDGHKIVSILLQARQRIQIEGGYQEVTVGELIDCASGAESPVQGGKQTIGKDDAHQHLRRMMIRVEKESLIFGNGSEWVGKQLENTSYRDGWKGVLRTIPGAHATKPQRFHTSLKLSRGTAIPLTSIQRED